MAAGRITTYRNNDTPDGVQVDGLNDEAFGNLRAHVGPDGAYVTDSPGSVIYNDANGNPIVVGSPNDQHCPSPCIHGNFDLPDLKFSGPPGTLQWEELSGPVGTTVERWNAQQVTPVGTPLAAVATMPYFRDDSCFDDGTGMDPGPKLHLRSATEPSTWGYDPVTGIPVSPAPAGADRKSTRLNSSHRTISYAVFCLKKKKHKKPSHSATAFLRFAFASVGRIPQQRRPHARAARRRASRPCSPCSDLPARDAGPRRLV